MATALPDWERKYYGDLDDPDFNNVHGAIEWPIGVHQ